MVSVTSAAEGTHGSECVLRARARGCGGARRLMRAAHFRSSRVKLFWLVASPHFFCKMQRSVSDLSAVVKGGPPKRCSRAFPLAPSLRLR